jgi:peptide/nickel transport system substrate-binding protein
MQLYTRRDFTRLAGAGAIMLAGASLIGGCGSQAGSASSQTQANVPAAPANTTQVSVAMSTSSEPTSGFDPIIDWGCGEHMHEPLIQSTLVTTNTKMEFTGDLATGWEVSGDGLTWTFYLRHDAYFSDGTKVTARDVAFTINTVTTTAASQVDLSFVRKATAKDDYTAVIKLKRPFNALMYSLAVLGIVPAASYGPGYGSKPIGSGRYLLESWQQGQQAILTANPHYYGAQPKMQRVVVVFMEEESALAAAQAGQVDVAFTTATYGAQKVAGYDLLTCQTVDCRGISLPTIAPGGTRRDGANHYAAGNAVTANRALRQAINYGLDRDTLVKNTLGGFGSVAYSVCDGLPWASKGMQVKTSTAKAQSLLSKGGWVRGDDGIWTLPAGADATPSSSAGGVNVSNGSVNARKQPLRAALDLYYPSSDSVRQAMANEFANQMKTLGVEINLHGGSWDQIYPQEFSNPVLWGWGSNSPAQVYNLYNSAGTCNYACYQSKAVDGHLQKALDGNINTVMLGKDKASSGVSVKEGHETFKIKMSVSLKDSYKQWQDAQWDAKKKTGIAPQGEATWVWLANVQHLYFYRQGLHIAKQKLHPHGQGWAIMNNVDKWTWA